ncbi:DUF2726 domain-containing protein [Aliivibrio fischeri]|uniref:DUF2726 domain-containing protein n=1 Tax=Aliivibrio fischeri TaxID=668 RepID=UPI0007C44445|nr:DUF2726 domain-containing protein [Aliivibrio fischeri]MBP3140240.1 DUF2726 domain-containing protein [Aliivibrio fischeri]MBP3154625.1 DUF2726 domain-containing protein [Aliivibrio fischeri]MCE7575832.1 DUF2726 domain-containing protein [Aliivibrio fischeri]
MNLRLLNKYEEITYDGLERICKGRARVFAKVRLADIFKINDSGISNREFNYCLKAHFDFLVVNKNYQPIFVVEYDGVQHKTEKRQINNDLMKNNICKRFNLPILRANFNYISRKFKGIDLLTYFIECWFIYEDFQTAQRKGGISYCENFDPCSIISCSSEIAPRFPYWISNESQIAIINYYQQGYIKQQIPSDWVGIDHNGNYRCITWLEVSENDVVYTITGMRSQDFHCVNISKTIRMINIVELHQALKGFIHNKTNVLSIEQFKMLLKKFTSSFEARGSCVYR